MSRKSVYKLLSAVLLIGLLLVVTGALLGDLLSSYLYNLVGSDAAATVEASVGAIRVPSPPWNGTIQRLDDRANFRGITREDDVGTNFSFNTLGDIPPPVTPDAYGLWWDEMAERFEDGELGPLQAFAHGEDVMDTNIEILPDEENLSVQLDVTRFADQMTTHTRVSATWFPLKGALCQALAFRVHQTDEEAPRLFPLVTTWRNTIAAANPATASASATASARAQTPKDAAKAATQALRRR